MNLAATFALDRFGDVPLQLPPVRKQRTQQSHRRLPQGRYRLDRDEDPRLFCVVRSQVEGVPQERQMEQAPSRSQGRLGLIHGLLRLSLTWTPSKNYAKYRRCSRSQKARQHRNSRTPTIRSRNSFDCVRWMRAHLQRRDSCQRPNRNHHAVPHVS